MRAAKARLQSRKWRGGNAPREPKQRPRRKAPRGARRGGGGAGPPRGGGATSPRWAPAWPMPRLSGYLGGWIRHGTWYPDRPVRLFDRRRGRVVAHHSYDLHERVVLDGPCGVLRADLLHLPYRTLEEHLRTIDSY